MNDGLQVIDLLVLLALAVFFISRLRSVLGKQIDDEGPKKDPKKPQERMIQLRDRKGTPLGASAVSNRPAVDIDAPILADIADPDVTTGLAAIKTAEPSFSVSEFLSGAKMAFDMILEAFAKGDKPTLEGLLSKEIYQDFAAAVDARKTADSYDENTLVSIQSADIVRAALNGRKAEITVNFVSEQISVERDKEGNILSGNPSETTLVTDEWTFTRDTRSPNPNWTLIAT